MRWLLVVVEAFFRVVDALNAVGALIQAAQLIKKFVPNKKPDQITTSDRVNQQG